MNTIYSCSSLKLVVFQATKPFVEDGELAHSPRVHKNEQLEEELVTPIEARIPVIIIEPC